MDAAPTGGSICNTKRHCPLPLRGIGVPLRRYSLAFRALITQSPSKVRPGGRRELRPTPLRAHSVRPYSICAPFWQINGVGFRCTPMPREVAQVRLLVSGRFFQGMEAA